MSIWSKIKERIANWASNGKYAELVAESENWKQKALALEERLDYYFRQHLDNISNKAEEVFGEAKVVIEDFTEDVTEKTKAEVISIRTKAEEVVDEIDVKRKQPLEDINFQPLKEEVKKAVDTIASIMKDKK